MLIVTLPPITREADIASIVHHPLVGGVRYNVGMRTPYSSRVTLEKLHHVALSAKKELWIDLKGRQLRILQWADPTYGDILLNHAIRVEVPARIIFRGGGQSNIVHVDGNRIFVDPPPPHALGAGQAVNVLGKGLEVEGYLTEQDFEYIDVGGSLGISDFMLSFVEKESDLQEVLGTCPSAQLVLKIESLGGLEFVERLNLNAWSNCHLMAARDDLLIELGDRETDILPALVSLVEKDQDAIVASWLLTSLEKGRVSASDLSDLEYLWHLGYRNFMLSDTVSHHYFREAIRIWTEFLELHKEG